MNGNKLAAILLQKLDHLYPEFNINLVSRILLIMLDILERCFASSIDHSNQTYQIRRVHDKPTGSLDRYGLLSPIQFLLRNSLFYVIDPG